jgi:DNA polymerase-3 subunit epsilon
VVEPGGDPPRTSSWTSHHLRAGGRAAGVDGAIGATRPRPLLAPAQLGGAGDALRGAPFAVLDVETTGLGPRRERIVELAVVRVTASGERLAAWSTLLDPGRPVGATHIHGITDADVRGAPAFTAIVGDLLALLEGAILVAHNAGFDAAFLAAELDRAGVTVPTLPGLCTLWLAQRLIRAPDYQLATCARLLGVRQANAHHALGDVDTTVGLLGALLALHPPLRWPLAPPPLPPVPPSGSVQARADAPQPPAQSPSSARRRST